jgi:RNA polymerase sigma-70 factor (ECF subfamily)
VPLTDFNSSAEKVERLYSRYLEELKRFFRRHSLQRDRADDLVQLVYLRLLNYASLHEVREPEKFLYRIAWNVLYTENRRAARERTISVSFTPEAFDQVCADDSRLWSDDSTAQVDEARFLEALGTLTREQQAVFVLHYIDGLTCEQVAEVTGIKLDTVKKYVSRVLAHLHECYGAGALGRR